MEGVVRTFLVQSDHFLTDTNAEFVDDQFELMMLFLFLSLVVVPLLGKLLTYSLTFVLR